MSSEWKSSFSSQRPRTGEEIRKAFLEFYEKKSHLIIPSASLIPEDPTVLLTIAGMLPFKPVFLCQQERPAPRATTSQKCIRTNDIENVGRTARHHTFFEMLGNFSFGDYFKEEAIKWAWEITTTVFCLSPKNLVISVFKNDLESEKIWIEDVGVSPKRIIRMDEEDNFWSSGITGPCGPCSEIYYDFNPELGDENIDLNDDSRFIEFYNLVFMQFNKDSTGKLNPLEKCNIDTGMGLERMAQILQDVPNNYETDLIYPLILETAAIANIKYENSDSKRKISLKVIADHSRAVVHLICDGVLSSNLGRGYVLRRLLRRMIRHGKLLGISKPFLALIGESAINLMQSTFPLLKDKKEFILRELKTEEIRFLDTLERGELLLKDIISRNPDIISGPDAFELYDTYGFPVELTQEISREVNLDVDIDSFHIEMNKQRQRAKAASSSFDLTIQTEFKQLISKCIPTEFLGYSQLSVEGQVLSILLNGKQVDTAMQDDKVQVILDKTSFFGESGGQIGDNGVITAENLIVEIKNVTKENDVYIHSGVIIKGCLKISDPVNIEVNKNTRFKAESNHTATHLLQSALKKVIDSSVSQRGSLVAFDRLRFDFNAPRALKKRELIEVEELVNQWISEAHLIEIETMPKAKALSLGALAMFGEKYGDVVRVVNVPGVSMELCGGTHVSNTLGIGGFKIISEIGISAGIRRIEAVSGPAMLDYFNERDSLVSKLSDMFKSKPDEIIKRVYNLQQEVKYLTKEIDDLQKKSAIARVLVLANEVQKFNNTQIIVSRIDGIRGGDLQNAARDLQKNLGENAIVFLAGLPNINETNKVIFVAAFGQDVVNKGIQAGKFVGSIAQLCGGGGGGRPNLAQAGGRDSNELDNALKSAEEKLYLALNDSY
tara:strand:- start:7863 stop:10535 length:2673 start_codon:yes stop_codon:yes gene_type:complete